MNRRSFVKNSAIMALATVLLPNAISQNHNLDLSNCDQVTFVYTDEFEELMLGKMLSSMEKFMVENWGLDNPICIKIYKGESSGDNYKTFYFIKDKNERRDPYRIWEILESTFGWENINDSQRKPFRKI